MHNQRQVFWKKALDVLENPRSWQQVKAEVSELVIAADKGWDLVRSEAPDEQLIVNGVGGPNNLLGSGLRSFLISWNENDLTSIHGHGSIMLVYVISGRLGITEYHRIDSDMLKESQTRFLSTGDSIFMHADNDRHDNFIHRITCVEAGWSLHIYGDDPGLGQKFSESQCLRSE